MVVTFEVLFLIVCFGIGLRWFLRTNLYRGHRRSPGDPGQHGYGWGSEGMYTHRSTPNRQSHRE